MIDNQFEGVVIAALERRDGITKSTAKPWASQDFVIEETKGAFPAKMLFTVFGKDKLDTWNIAVGKHLRVHINVNAKEYNGKWYNSVQAWKVEELEPIAQPPVASPQSAPVQMPSTEQEDIFAPDKSGELPF